jgi:hypothetical protein
MSAAFAARAARDACGYSISWTVDADQITGVTVSSNNGSTCNSPIPITFPVSPTSTLGFPTEQIGSDPLTVWVSLTGNPVNMTLSTPISFNIVQQPVTKATTDTAPSVIVSTFNNLFKFIGNLFVS